MSRHAKQGQPTARFGRNTANSQTITLRNENESASRAESRLARVAACLPEAIRLRDVAELPLPIRWQSHSPPAAAVASDPPTRADGARWCRARAPHSCHRHKPSRQTAVRCTFGRSGVAAAWKAPREEEWESCGTSRSNKRAARMKALRNADRSVFAPALHRPRVSQ
jgi:hypothetical protein